MSLRNNFVTDSAITELRYQTDSVSEATPIPPPQPRRAARARIKLLLQEITNPQYVRGKKQPPPIYE